MNTTERSATEGARRLVGVANQLAALGITDVAGLTWTSYDGITVHLRCVEDVNVFADAANLPESETDDGIYRRVGRGGRAFCGAGRVRAEFPRRTLGDWSAVGDSCWAERVSP